MRDSKVDKWRRWVSHEGFVREEVLMLHLRRYVWQETARMVRENESLPDSYWWRFLVDNYIACQAVAIRRQADTNPRVVSLGRLLTEIRDDAARITRLVLAGIWQPEDSWGERDLDEAFERFSGAARGHVDPAIPEADLVALRSGAATVTVYADRHLAHVDSRPLPPEELPSVNDLHAAIDLIGSHFRRYHLLLTSADMPVLIPILQHDWTAPFRQAWIPPGTDFFPRPERESM